MAHEGTYSEGRRVPDDGVEFVAVHFEADMAVEMMQRVDSAESFQTLGWFVGCHGDGGAGDGA